MKQPLPQTGDLLFVSDVQSDFSKAINSVTQIDQSFSYTHAGILENVQDTIYLIHASPQNGVERILLQDYISHKNGDSSVFHIYRLTDKDIDYDKVINQAKAYLGQPYNSSFILSDTSQYCSELLFNAFDGFDVFTVEPMTFNDPATDKPNPTWEKYFKDRGEEIPEGSLGCNPNGLAKNKKLKILFTATCSDVKKVEFYNINSSKAVSSE